ncbi:MAG: hypothetical protein CM15mP88_0070 [Pseudomonadota bacterium]|nr:MAG: hypothetical protein CM15mP88_0070 [Pseudomonadota bacterium]
MLSLNKSGESYILSTGGQTSRCMHLDRNSQVSIFKDQNGGITISESFQTNQTFGDSIYKTSFNEYEVW